MCLAGYGGCQRCRTSHEGCRTRAHARTHAHTHTHTHTPVPACLSVCPSQRYVCIKTYMYMFITIMSRMPVASKTKRPSRSREMLSFVSKQKHNRNMEGVSPSPRLARSWTTAPEAATVVDLGSKQAAATHACARSCASSFGAACVCTVSVVCSRRCAWAVEPGWAGPRRCLWLGGGHWEGAAGREREMKQPGRRQVEKKLGGSEGPAGRTVMTVSIQDAQLDDRI